ncbi:MAG: winged helix-turn-helix domain-containing protein [Acidobacteriota bacterium]
MIYTFGIFSFDAGSLELTREGRRVALEPQPARALARLLAGAGALVTRDQMREAIWGSDTHVDYDRGLAYCVGQVRSALGDSGDNPRFVQTMPKRGYRFVAPVTTGAVPSNPTAPAPEAAPAEVIAAAPDADAAAPGSTRRWLLATAAATAAAVAGWRLRAAVDSPGSTVAVSIFDNETGDAALDGFVHGLSDVVVTRLTAVAPGRVGVIGNAAPLRQPRNLRNLRTLATTLAADYLVLGQLQRQNDDFRFIVHFIRLNDQVHLSAQRFIRTPADVFAFEGDVVAEAERAVLAFVAAAARS